MKVPLLRDVALIVIVFVFVAVSGSAPASASSLPDPAVVVIPRQGEPVVNAVMFWSQSCAHCHAVINNVLPQIKAQYGDQFNLLMIEMKTTADWNLLREVAAQLNIGSYGVPFLVIGDRVLIGSGQIPAQLPGLIDAHLASGGLALPDIPGLDQGVLFTTPGDIAREAEPSEVEGHTLALIVMLGMIGALVFVGAAVAQVARGKSLAALPGWVALLTPVLVVAGLLVAGYLSYVETQSVEAVCGPVGDCNAVQSSSYATLFGVLPVGVLGFAGYVAILAAWLVARLRTGDSALRARQAVLAMTVFGTLFSVYLTYLELYVIKAVCAWCLTSAVIITLLMLVNTVPALPEPRPRRRRGRRR